MVSDPLFSRVMRWITLHRPHGQTVLVSDMRI